MTRNVRRVIGMNIDSWPPQAGDVHFNEGGQEHLTNSDYHQAQEYGREVGKIFQEAKVPLAQALGPVAVAFTEVGLEADHRVQQTAFFRGLIDASYTPVEKETQS